MAGGVEQIKISTANTVIFCDVTAPQDMCLASAPKHNMPRNSTQHMADASAVTGSPELCPCTRTPAGPPQQLHLIKRWRQRNYNKTHFPLSPLTPRSQDGGVILLQLIQSALITTLTKQLQCSCKIVACCKTQHATAQQSAHQTGTVARAHNCT